MVGGQELELMTEGAARAAVLAGTMSCYSSEYLLVHALHVIFFFLIYSGSVLGGVYSLFPIRVQTAALL